MYVTFMCLRCGFCICFQNGKVPFSKLEYMVVWFHSEFSYLVLLLKSHWDPTITWRDRKFKLKFGGYVEELYTRQDVWHRMGVTSDVDVPDTKLFSVGWDLMLVFGRTLCCSASGFHCVYFSTSQVTSLFYQIIPFIFLFLWCLIEKKHLRELKVKCILVASMKIDPKSEGKRPVKLP